MFVKFHLPALCKILTTGFNFGCGQKITIDTLRMDQHKFLCITIEKLEHDLLNTIKAKNILIRCCADDWNTLSACYNGCQYLKWSACICLCYAMSIFPSHFYYTCTINLFIQGYRKALLHSIMVESIPLSGGEMWPLFENLKGWRLNYFIKYLQLTRVMEAGMKYYGKKWDVTSPAIKICNNR